MRSVLWFLKDVVAVSAADLHMRRKLTLLSGGSQNLSDPKNNDLSKWLQDRNIQLSPRQDQTQLFEAVAKHQQVAHGAVYVDLGEKVLWVSRYLLTEQPAYMALEITKEPSISGWDLDEQLLGASWHRVPHTLFFAHTSPSNLLLWLDDHNCILTTVDLDRLVQSLAQIPRKGTLYCEILHPKQRLECVLYEDVLP